MSSLELCTIKHPTGVEFDVHLSQYEINKAETGK